MSEERAWSRPAGRLPGDGDTLGVAALGGDGLLQFVQLTGFLEFLHQALDCFLAPLIILPAVLLLLARRLRGGGGGGRRRLASFLPAQQTLDDGRRERQDGHGGAGEGKEGRGEKGGLEGRMGKGGGGGRRG